MSTNQALFEQAQSSIPGGVNSPVRAFKSVGGNPIFISSANGAIMQDVEGNEYVDYINSWGPMIMGHAFPPVISAIQEQVKKSTSYGTPTGLEIQMAELIKAMVPGLDLIRMVNSGTEACMSAIRLAKGYTKRNKFIKFSGCYHGHADCFLIAAGSGASTLGKPNSDGVSDAIAADTITATFNDLEEVQKIFAEYPDQIAAIIVEPVAGNMGCIPPKDGFLEGLRDICDQHQSVLIFDEVMTGFRLAPGGAQELYGVHADLVTFGKIIGGGMPVGAFGGKQEIMECLAPLGGVYQAGTLSGNPIAMVAGYTLLKTLHENREIYTALNEKTTKLKEGFLQAIKDHGKSFQVNQVGSMISIHFCEQEVVNFESAGAGNNELFKQFFHYMLKEGFYLPPSAFESWFISNSINDSHIDQTIAIFARFLSELK